MKKKASLLLISTLLLFAFTLPNSSEASKLDDINRQLNELQQQAWNLQIQQQGTDDSITAAQKGKQQTQVDLDTITSAIDVKVAEMVKISEKIDTAEFALVQNGQQLEEIDLRMEERSKLLDSRVQLMYMNGNVSYLEVLLDASSLSDFLGRLDSLEMLAAQDQRILDEQEQDKLLALNKQEEITAQLVHVQELYRSLNEAKAALMKQEQEKEIIIASYDEQLDDLHGISEEQDKLLVELAQKRSELYEQQQAEQEKEKEKERKRRDQQRSSSSTGGSGGDYSGGKLAVPLHSHYVVSSGYGSRVDPISGEAEAFHSGIDMAAPQGTSIYAAASGVVLVAEWWNGYGYTVVIDHGNGLWTLYGHIRKGGIVVSKGDQVMAGDQIAEVGKTGRATGYHLHFEVRVNGNRVDPEPYLQ